MVISARQACLSISETDLDFSTQSSIGFMKNYPKRENIQLAAVLLLMSEDRKNGQTAFT